MKKNINRIAFVTEVFLPKIDGITNRLKNTIRILEKKGIETKVFCPYNSVDQYCKRETFRIPGIYSGVYPGVTIGIPIFNGIEKGLREYAPDILHAIGPVSYGLYGMLASKKLNIPTIASYHTDFPGYLSRYSMGLTRPLMWSILKKIHNLASHNLCPTNFTRQELLAKGFTNVDVWRGGVDLSLFSPQRRSHEFRKIIFPHSPDKPVILYAGRLAKEKNLEDFEFLVSRFKDLNFVVAGDGPYKKKLQNRLSHCGNIHYLGFLSGAKLATAYASADILFMPSETETMGFVMLEAMASGIPVVAIDARSNKHIIQNKITGLIYRPNCETHLIDSINQIIKHDILRIKIQKNIINQRHSLSWESETESLCQKYENAILDKAKVSDVSQPFSA